MVIAGSLACQKDSYKKEITSKVIACEKSSHSDGYCVILDDTILFPEGGGQPYDHGLINDLEVFKVLRDYGNAVHYVSSPLDVGSEVVIKVDWERRWDHMQQHSAQHLISALAIELFNYETTSWNLGKGVSTIELNTSLINSEQLCLLECAVNEKIRMCLKMYPTFYDGIDDPHLKSVRTRGLPDDHVGPVRIVTIEDVESNMCCGTHVGNLSHLQSVKILGSEKAKKGKYNIVFIAGERVLHFATSSYEKDKRLTSLLKCGADEHISLLEKSLSSCKIHQKNASSLLREVALLEAKLFKFGDQKSYYFSHRKEGDNEYMNIINNEINDKNVIVFITVGDEKSSGLFFLSGPDVVLETLHKEVTALIEAKGALKNGKFQGKALKLRNRNKVEELIISSLN